MQATLLTQVDYFFRYSVPIFVPLGMRTGANNRRAFA